MRQDVLAPICAERPQPSSAQLIRPGRGAPLFVLSGGGASISELDKLLAALRTKRPLVGVPYWQAGADGVEPTSVEAMAEVARAMIQAYQPAGRYNLVGYSLGGFVAIETARKLIDDGKAVAPPIVIDAIPGRAHWSKSILLRAAPPLALRRALRLARAAMQAAKPATYSFRPGEQRCRTACLTHRPRYYPGPIQLLYARDEPGIGALAPEIWRSLASRVSCHPFAASHVDMARSDLMARAIAQHVDALIDAPRNDDGARSALLLTSLSWITTARLARSLIQTGYFIDAVAPKSHPLTQVEGMGAFYPLSARCMKTTIEAAILDSRPDILIPVDDFIALLLYDLHATSSDPGLRAVIERSLGKPEFYRKRHSRCWIGETALRNGVSTPVTAPIADEAAMVEALTRTGLPAFVKTDGSWGGTGIRRLRTLDERHASWREIHRAFGPVRAIKRALIDGDIALVGRLLERHDTVFSAQSEVSGQLAIVSAVCHEGELLGMISASVLAQQSEFGPASRIKLDNLPIFREPVARMVRALGLSGFCGFDFVMGRNDKRAWLIEVNPRATRTSDMLVEGAEDLLAVYLQAIGGTPKRRGDFHPRNAIV